MLSLLAVFALFSPSASVANILIGNGGCGRTQNGAVVLEDFYAHGVRNPRLGRARGPIDLKHVRLGNFFAEIGIGRELLENKFNELEQISPGLGKSTLAILLSYEWETVPAPLYLDLQCMGRGQVQVANRYRGKITVDRNIIAKMARPDRLGLIFHEIIYSLVRPDCDQTGCRQEAATAMLITALLFENPGRDRDSLRAILKDKLMLPVLGDCTHNELRLAVKVSDRASGKIFFESAETFSHMRDRETEARAVSELFGKACRGIAAAPAGATRFTLRARVPTFEVTPTRISSRQDDLPFSFKESFDNRLAYTQNDDTENCEAKFTRLYSSWRSSVSRRSVRLLDYCPAVGEG